MKKIAIVGANSYIARNIITVLKQNYSDFELFLYDKAEQHIDGEQNYESIDILDYESVKRINFKCDIIYMFIGKTGGANGFEEYNTFIDINERALLCLLNVYRMYNSKAKIIFPSTRLVYKGKHGLLSENDNKEFNTIYAINKYACEKYLEMFNKVYGIKYCIFRICVPYGTMIPKASSYGTAEFMLNMAAKGHNITLYGDGNARRTIIYMGDLCNALIRGAVSDNCINNIFNIGGENYSLKEMAELIAKKYNVEIEYIPYPDIAKKIESGDTVFNDEKFQNACGIEYKMKFSEWCKA